MRIAHEKHIACTWSLRACVGPRSFVCPEWEMNAYCSDLPFDLALPARRETPPISAALGNGNSFHSKTYRHARYGASCPSATVFARHHLQILAFVTTAPCPRSVRPLFSLYSPSGVTTNQSITRYSGKVTCARSPSSGSGGGRL